ncbi:MAG: Ig-like domain-containing protein [Ruminococcus sp.]|nr:Ig-like domain-containing protein [Ruminococcus sp.]MDE7226241.1 Ig-like domain-containing protein [Ruminococcus sp.]
MENTTPKKRVTKKMARQRQLGALAVIALLLLLLIIFVFKGCSKGGGRSESSEPEVTTTTGSTIATTTAPPATTTVATTMNPLAAQVLIDKREMFIDDIGDSDVAIISGYPEGSGEENEVWKSLDESIATVDSLGHVTGVGAGQTYIILSFDNNPGIEIDIRVSVADGSGTVTDSTSSAVDDVYNNIFGDSSGDSSGGDYSENNSDYGYDSSVDGGSAFDTYTTPAE